ncbi:hypothetical protein F4561_002646 [Lipingzhangella halophila]|uniref:Uncharacterized protein n=1 Tax=Lipingzhangella halophila TaxID=1783352 RepID=A0A7W7RI04_9ACTN|nr:hypothetical protein [Lipingzhangella halophila]MBB4931826.1 hypothetical protein [Lipingzhangella halophila]
MSDYRLRQGHHAPRNLWEHPTNQPPNSKSGTDVGRVDTPELAAEIVAAVNTARAAGHHHDDPITEAIHAALVELHPDAAGRNCTGDWKALKDDAAHIANRVRATVRDRSALVEQVEQGVRHWFAQTYGQEAPAPLLLVHGIRGHLGSLVTDELIALNARIAGLHAELEEARADLEHAYGFWWTQGEVRVERRDHGEGYQVSWPDPEAPPTVDPSLLTEDYRDRESALTRAHQLAEEQQ